MSNIGLVWLASYPRSGNTYLRTVLWHCFGLRSASVYANDLGGNRELEQYVGHIEHSPDMEQQMLESGIPLLKTHEHAKDNGTAIYIVRDGRAASVSLWKYLNEEIPLRSVIDGQHIFGKWSDHVLSWHPWDRPGTLLLKYEQLRDNLPAALESIGNFLNRENVTTEIPDRNMIAAIDGRWVRKNTDWKTEITGEDLERFYELNSQVLEKCGYR